MVIAASIGMIKVSQRFRQLPNHCTDIISRLGIESGRCRIHCIAFHVGEHADHMATPALGLNPVKRFVAICVDQFRNLQFAVLFGNVFKGLNLKINHTFWFISIRNLHNVSRPTLSTNTIRNIPFTIQCLEVAINAV